MRCEEFKQEWMLEAMAGGTGKAVEHTKECAACAEELAEMQKTLALLDEWEAPEPSPYFDTRLHARLREEAANPAGLRAKWLRLVRVPALAGALGAAAFAGFTAYHRQAIPAHECAVNDLQSFDKNYDLLKDLDQLDDSTNQTTDLPNDTEL